MKNVLAKIFFLFKKQDRKTMRKLWLMLKFCQFSKRLAGFFYRVKETNEEKLISSKVIDKVFFYSDEPRENKPENCYVVKLCTSFEHS